MSAQHYWLGRIHGMAEAIGQVVHDASVRRQASLLGRQIREEDGVARATALIDTFAHRGRF